MENKRSVLVTVIKDRRDLAMLLKKHIYRMPVARSPRQKADYIAFYQPSVFGKSGSRIKYYAKVKDCRIVKREQILPDEKGHPRSQENYYLTGLYRINRLKKAVSNRSKTRISFGFTSLGRLLKAADILELFDVAPMEEMVLKALCKKGIKVFSQYGFSFANKKRYRMDFAVFCRKGRLDTECDGQKWHSLKAQRIKDKERDKILKSHEWTILRFKEKEVVKNINGCVKKVEKAIRKLGGTI